jgi:hypothetical protein
MLSSIVLSGSDSDKSRRSETLFIEAPFDVRVEEILATNGSVRKGQSLMDLSSYHLDQMETHIALLTEHISIIERPFLDGRIDAEIGLLHQKVTLFSGIKDAMEQRRRKIDEETGIGKWGAYFQEKVTTDSQTSSTTTTKGHTVTENIPHVGVEPFPINQGESEEHSTTATNGTTNSVVFLAPLDYKTDVDLVMEYNRLQTDLIDATLAADQAERKRDDALDKNKIG